VSLRVALGIVALALVALPLPAWDDGGAPAGAEVVSTETLLAVMGREQGYELTATTNGARLQADVLLELIREREAKGAGLRPLFIGHREWYEAFLARTGLAPSAAPLYVRLSYEIGQDMLVDYRHGEVIDAVLKGPVPRIAANVVTFWARATGKADHFGYDDVSSRPHLRVTQDRVVSYRLVDYGDRLWHAEIRGLRGRPTSGPLGVLFDLIGEASVEESRSAMLPDGVQVVRARATKWGMVKTEMLTLWPDGRTERGVPADRSDLMALEARLTEPLRIRFKPLPPEPPDP
jgi:hypothetical protein